MRGCSLPLRLSYAERRATLEERCGRRARLIDASAIDYGALHATIASGRVRLATDGGAKMAR
jgi:hypothetical protein